MEQRPEAEKEFQALVGIAPQDLLAATQLGFLLYARGEHAAAQPLFDRVLAGKDEDLANRVRAVLRLPQVLQARPDPVPASIDAKVMAERSIKAGYVRDALKYLQTAHEADPGDFDIMLKLGWTLNILRQDREAYRWFDLARRSTDPQIGGEAQRAWRNLRRSNARTAITAWLYPLYSTRWRDLFSYGQVRLEFRAPLGIRPYLSTRFVGDTRLTIGAALPGAASPQYLSESAFIFAAGLSTVPWHGIFAWAEAGTAVNYLDGRTRPDYRGGVSIARGIGHLLGGESPGWFADVSADGVFLSRFDNDFLMYEQTRAGYTFSPAQFYWNTNLTIDAKSLAWANFIEAGPGLRIATPFLANATWFSVNLLRGTHLVRPGQLGRLQYTDLRAGFWYAFTR